MEAAPKVRAEPNVSPVRRLTTPVPAMDMVMIGRSAYLSDISRVAERSVRTSCLQVGITAVSYTHLDVYKRQLQGCVANMYAGNPVCCLVNPFLGHEAEGIAPAEKAKKVMVIGGGVAGLCAAFIAQEKGHQVTLYEASDKRCV